MKKVITTIVLSILSVVVFAQYSISEDSAKTGFRSKIAVFAPIYIDSAFTDNSTKTITSNALPKIMLSGLDFYNGVMMAADSLKTDKANIEILFYDTKSKTEPMNKILNYKVWDSVSFIIAYFKDRNEIKPLADFAMKKNIVLISATFPNDGGVTANPNFVILNSTLRTHCEGIYKYVQKYYSTSNIVYVKTKGKLEDDIQNTFREMNKQTASVALKFKTVELTDSFTIKQLSPFLDSTKQNTIICGTVNETFGLRLVKTLGTLKNYRSVAIGMPTWDGIKDFNKSIAKEDDKTSNTAKSSVEIIYSTPYYFGRNDKLNKALNARYKNKFAARASDWFFKGFETVYYFSNVLVKYNRDFKNELNNKDFVLFNEFDIKPITAKQSDVVDYLENKKLYFIKKQDGIVKSVNN